MLVLALDSTTRHGSVAVVEDGGLRGELVQESADGHSRWLLPAVSSLLHHAGVRVSDLDGFAVTTGPGSFTGLRVGIATVQGLALAARRPCFGLPALDVLASLVTGRAATIVAMIDAYRDDVFAGVYDGEGHPLGAPRLAAPAHVLEALPGPVAVVGDGAVRYRDRIRERCPSVSFPECPLFLASALGRKAVHAFGRGEGVAPAALRPLYIREADVRK